MARKPRVQKSRNIRKTFYIFCEGKSEKAYIEFLRQTLRPSTQLLPIVCKSNISEKEINSNLLHREAIGSDRVFVMYDIDVPGMYERISSIKKATMLISNPCLELWYLLHFTDLNKNITTAECIDRLKQHVKGYKKGIIHPELYTVLFKELCAAEKRAFKLQSPGNPSTTIWKLTKEIER